MDSLASKPYEVASLVLFPLRETLSFETTREGEIYLWLCLPSKRLTFSPNREISARIGLEKCFRDIMLGSGPVRLISASSFLYSSAETRRFAKTTTWNIAEIPYIHSCPDCLSLRLTSAHYTLCLWGQEVSQRFVIILASDRKISEFVSGTRERARK
jgi:hypothetical protein